MTAYLHTTGFVPDEPPVSLNPGSNHNPFAVVGLTTDGLTEMAVHTATEARGLKEAFARAEEILTGAGRP
jgi:hypothetical protein